MSFIKLTSARFNLLSIRLFSTKHNSSKFIRQQFLDFFIKDNNHHFIKSSSVIPFCDPTLSFTNAGMNQFKNILLGNHKAKHKRVANSQKCIRVGGKHNDLSIVGTDSYHHTFFEMLGNWSFGDYFKKDACELAWKLLTEVYQIPPQRLYVSYFKGDEKMGLEPDIECKEIWRQIGMPQDRIIGFGAKENFWEMGATGPCGGCSEIHVDHLPTFRSLNRAVDVNQDKSDLTELWNIVFIEYFRHNDGLVEKLPEQHIDTGMGFERLVAFLQGKTSNYDSDLFIPIFEKIQKLTGVPAYAGSFDCDRDTAYRIIADHSRMVAVSLADGMFPEQNHRLRKIIRKCIKISEQDFNNDNLLLETIPVVSNILGETFNELNDKLSTVIEVVKHEQEVFKLVRSKMSKDVEQLIVKNPKLAELDMFDYPDFLVGYKNFLNYKNSCQNNVLSGDFIYYIYSSCGFDLELISQLAEIEGMTIDRNGFDEKMQQDKTAYLYDKQLNTELISALDNMVINSTNNDLKYNYTYDDVHHLYRVEPVKSKIISILDLKGNVSSTTTASSPSVKLILEKSSFYYESGGQEADDGFICKNGKKFKLKGLSNQKNFVIHEVEIDGEESLAVGDDVELHVDSNKRTALTRNHSAAHLVNSAMRKVLNSPVYQKSSLVTNEHLKIELSCLGPKLGRQDFEKFENLIRKFIFERPLERQVSVLNSQELQNEKNVVMVPGEFYPEDGIRLVTFGDFSKELCCGTHVFNTNELVDFTFLSMRSTGRSSYLFTATTGSAATEALSNGQQLVDDLKMVNEKITSENCEEVESKVRDVSTKLKASAPKIALLKKLECQELSAEIDRKVKRARADALTSILHDEMKAVLKKSSENPFIIHFLSCSEMMNPRALQQATGYVTDRPVFIVSLTKTSVVGRCCVPKEVADNKFNATLWMQEFAKVYKANVFSPKDHNPKEVANMKEKGFDSKKHDEFLQRAAKAVNEFATKFSPK